MLRNKIIIGSRGSILAMAQTELVVKMLKEKFPEMDFEINMFTTVIIGNSKTFVKNGKMITPRGYKVD